MEQWHEARQYSRDEEGSVICSLCSHRCKIKEGKHGICGVRVMKGGILYATTYGKISSEAVDPIEKKPLFHFLPGTLSYSLGSVGCNFHCEHCQNWQISRAGITDLSLRDLPPAEGIRRATARGCASISWTYNEPTIWHEYPFDMGTLAKKEGLGTVYVTNGYITEEALREISTVLDAFRVDIKAFSDEFYRKVCGAKLQPVLDATTLARELGLHIEIVNLVIPGMNDSPGETGALIRWIINNVGPDTPVHFTRYHPMYHMKEPGPTPVALLERIYRQAREHGLNFPYLGNVSGHRSESTSCPVCGALLIERQGFASIIRNLSGHSCTSCGAVIAYVDHV